MKCENCGYTSNKWGVNTELEIVCPRCLKIADGKFVENFSKRKLSYTDAIQIRDVYEAKKFKSGNPDLKSSWAELDIALNFPLSRKIRSSGEITEK